MNRKNVQMQVWDCAGSDNFTQEYSRVKQTDAFLILFDVTSRASFDMISLIHYQNKSISGPIRSREQVTIIVGTKTD